MEHVDAEVLALLALGEPASDADRAHIDACERCSEEVAELATVVTVGRAVTPGDTLVAPAPRVWERVSTELALGTGDAGAAGVATDGAAMTPGAPASPALASVTPLRRRRSGWLVAAAAAAGLVVGGFGVRALDGAGSTADPAGDVVASAALDPLPGWDATGAAVVEESDDGARTLVLTLEGEPDDDGFREVWLIDRDVTRLISLGVLEGSEGRFTLPSGIDLADFAVVDVSEEPYDGDPAHSGSSIIRGVLDA